MPLIPEMCRRDLCVRGSSRPPYAEQGDNLIGRPCPESENAELRIEMPTYTRKTQTVRREGVEIMTPTQPVACALKDVLSCSKGQCLFFLMGLPMLCVMRMLSDELLLPFFSFFFSIALPSNSSR